jgi:hypothetical protein
VVRTDSAGVSLVESLEPGWGAQPRWQVDPAPILDLARSGAGPDHEFYRVRDATRLPNGSLAVVNEGSAEVRFYSQAGAFHGSVGGKGDGPGEFQRPISVERYRGDSLVVFDYWGRRATVLDPVHQVARTATFATPFTHELHALPDGRFILSVNSLLTRDASVGRVRVPQPLLLVSAEGVEHDTITVVPGLEEFVFEEGSGIPPLGRTGSAVVVPDGVATSDGEGVVVRVYALGGALRRILRVPGHPLDAPASVRDSIRKALEGSEGPDFIRAAALEMSKAVPARFPGISDLIVDSEGYLWAAEYHPRQVSGQPRGWLVFDSGGAWEGRVTLPADFDAFEIGPDYVLGRQRDALDVETVQLLRLIRR